MNAYLRKCHALLILKKAYRKIIELGKQNEGSDIMLSKIMQLDFELHGNIEIHIKEIIK